MLGTMLAAAKPNVTSSGAMKRKHLDPRDSYTTVGFKAIAATPCNSIIVVSMLRRSRL
jgi:hypothetical protein